MRPKRLPNLCPSEQLINAQEAVRKKVCAPAHLYKYRCPSKGRGIKSNRPIRRGEFVLYYHGQIKHKVDEDDDSYFFEVFDGKKTIYIDATKEDGSYGRLLNDNFESPNLKVRPIKVGKEIYPGFFATKDIVPHTPLEYVYGGKSSNYFWRKTTTQQAEVPVNEAPSNKVAENTMKKSTNSLRDHRLKVRLSQPLAFVKSIFRCNSSDSKILNCQKKKLDTTTTIPFEEFAQFKTSLQRLQNDISQIKNDQNVITDAFTKHKEESKEKFDFFASRMDMMLSQNQLLLQNLQFQPSSGHQKMQFRANLKYESMNGKMLLPQLETSKEILEDLVIRHFQCNKEQLSNYISAYQTELEKIANREVYCHRFEIFVNHRNGFLPDFSYSALFGKKNYEFLMKTLWEKFQKFQQNFSVSIFTVDVAIPEMAKMILKSISERNGAIMDNYDEYLRNLSLKLMMQNDENTFQENSNLDGDETPGKEESCSKTSHQVHSEIEAVEMISELEERIHEGSQSSFPAEEEAHLLHTRLESVEEYPKGCLKYIKPKRPCPFCRQHRSQLTRHIKLAHRKEQEVQQILTLGPSQQIIHFERLRKIGINEENKRRLIMNSQQDEIQPLMTQRGEKSKKIRKCPICQGFYSATYVRQHIKKCQVKFEKPSKCFKPLKISPKYGAVSLLDDVSKIEYLPTFVKNVLESFLDDEIGNECRSNPLIKYVGYSLYMSRAEPEDDKEKQKIQVIKKMVAGKMRLLCRLYLNFVKQVGRKINLDEMFDRENLDSFKRAVKELSKSNSNSRHILGHDIMNTARILQQRLRDLKKESEANEIESFSKALENPVNWVPLFGSQRTYASVKSTFVTKKPSNLPQLSNLSKLVHFLVSQVISLSKKPFNPLNYAMLRAVVLTRLTFLNARRGGEPCRLLMKHWVEAKNDAWLNKDFLSAALASNIDDKELLAQFKICFQKGKGSKSVSLMIPNDLISAMDILCDPIIRGKSGINSENQYVFATKGSNCYHAQGVSDIHHVMKRCNVTGIKAREMRHFMSTKQALMNLSGDARALFYLHMGHEKSVNIKSYQSELVIERITKVGKIIKTVDEYLQSENTFQGNSNLDEDETPGKEESCSKTSHQVHSEIEAVEMISELEERTHEENTFQENSNLDEDETPGKEESCSKTSHQVYSENEAVEMISELEERTLEVKSSNKWTPRKTKQIRRFHPFQKYLGDLSPLGAKGSIPKRREIIAFIRENPGIFSNRSPRTRQEIIRRKVIGLRQTNRRRYKCMLYKH